MLIIAYLLAGGLAYRSSTQDRLSEAAVALLAEQRAGSDIIAK